MLHRPSLTYTDAIQFHVSPMTTATTASAAPTIAFLRFKRVLGDGQAASKGDNWLLRYGRATRERLVSI